MSATLTPTKTVRHWSHSAVKGLVDECGHRWWLERIVGLPSPSHPRALSGSAYHAAIEEHEEQRRLWWYSGGQLGSKDGITLDRMLTVGHEAYDQGVANDDVDWTHGDPEQFAGELDVAIPRWWKDPIGEGQPGAGGSFRDRVMGWRPVAIETKFRMWLRGVVKLPVVGAGDGIYLDPETDELVGVDQKSSKDFKKYPHDGAGLRDQSAMYVNAARTARNLPGVAKRMVRFEYHVARVTQGSKSTFEGVRCVGLEIDELDIEYVAQRLQSAEVLHEQQVYVKTPDWFLCSPKWCPHHIGRGGTCDPNV